MSDTNKDPKNNNENYNQGPQGVDKAPGEDVATGNEDIMREAQKR